VPPSRDWDLRIRDILGAVDRIGRYTAGMTQEQFARDEKTVEAVCFALVVIGEAASRVSEEDQARSLAIPWRKMRGMRNIAVHEYFGLASGGDGERLTRRRALSEPPRREATRGGEFARRRPSSVRGGAA
jgi:uncharacterized protein with HEPN domain